MNTPLPRRPAPATPRRLAPIPGRSDAEEQTLAMILALTSELTVVRARLDACERLLAEAGLLPAGAIDAYDPDPAAQAEREVLRGRTIAKVLRPLEERAARDLAAINGREART